MTERVEAIDQRQTYEQGKTIFDRSVSGRRGIELPALDVPQSELPPSELLRDELSLPQIDQLTVVRHYHNLSGENFGVDTGTYPLGSCTMKYSPKIDDEIVSSSEFTEAHPARPELAQGNLQIFFELQGYLSQITGMDATSCTPMAGAQGELTGILLIKKYHQTNGQSSRTKVLIPDSAHGTNPATAAMAGYEVVVVETDSDGNTDLSDLQVKADEKTAAMMITYPSTLGLFDPNIERIIDIVHKAGGQVYGDGANMNALLGRVRPGDLGFDALHLNLHKTFSIPHGGGGPGAATISVKAHLAPFLPAPIVEKEEEAYKLVTPKDSIGRVGKWYGNAANLVRAYLYIRSLGEEGLKAVADSAVLNANYLFARLKAYYEYKYPIRSTVAHEVVLKGTRQKRHSGVRTLDIAKRLIDYGFHPPTIYFPLTVEEALMIEPTESETKEGLDAFIEAMIQIAKEAEENPELLKTAPHFTPVGRLDEAEAARRPDLKWKPLEP